MADPTEPTRDVEPTVTTRAAAPDEETRIVADISMSLDGFVTGPNPGLELGLGEGGEPLHTWAMQPDDVDQQVMEEGVGRSGAVIMGRRLFDIVDGPGGWNEEMGYGAREVATPPFFVVTHEEPASRRLVDLDFTFVTSGIAKAIDLACTEATQRMKDVVIMGGADVIRQAVVQGAVDELHIHLSPIVLGGGTPLFEAGDRVRLVQQSVKVSRHATHLTYAVER